MKSGEIKKLESEIKGIEPQGKPRTRKVLVSLARNRGKPRSIKPFDSPSLGRRGNGYLSTRSLLSEIKRLEKLVYYDELTGLLNRRGFNEKAEKTFQNIFSFRASNKEKRTAPRLTFSVVFIDLDDFKKINDVYGHDNGDKALKHAAKTLKRLLRKNDVYARWGGEEFVVALPIITENTAMMVAEKLRAGIEQSAIRLDGKKIKITMSVGVVMHNNEKTLSQMVEKADKAMYEAKKNGKNRVAIFVHD